MEEEPIHYERPCPRCGTAVTFGATGPVVVPGVTSCPSCGAEVSFVTGLHGNLGGRVVHADRRHPREAGVGDGAGWKSATCPACGGRVPLRGFTPSEHSGADPEDIGDTVTCPTCGVEVAPIADEVGAPG